MYCSGLITLKILCFKYQYYITMDADLIFKNKFIFDSDVVVETAYSRIIIFFHFNWSC